MVESKKPRGAAKREMSTTETRWLWQLAIGVFLILTAFADVGSFYAQTTGHDTTNDHKGDSAIHGVALDPNGAVVGRAEVTLTNTDSHSRQTTLTDQQGTFWFRSIASGKYQLTAASPGFYDFTIENVNLR